MSVCVGVHEFAQACICGLSLSYPRSPERGAAASLHRRGRESERKRLMEIMREGETDRQNRRRERRSDSIGSRGWWLPWGAMSGRRRVRERDGGRVIEGGREAAMWGAMWVEGKKKSGQRLQGERLERSRVCSVHEETGQGVRLRNSLQWLSQRHVDHHVLPPSLPSILTLFCPLFLFCPLRALSQSIAHCLPAQMIFSFFIIIIFCSSSLGHSRSTCRAVRTRSAAVKRS